MSRPKPWRSAYVVREEYDHVANQGAEGTRRRHTAALTSTLVTTTYLPIVLSDASSLGTQHTRPSQRGQVTFGPTDLSQYNDFAGRTIGNGIGEGIALAYPGLFSGEPIISR